MHNSDSGLARGSPAIFPQGRYRGGGVIMRAQFLVDILSRLTMFTDWLM